MSSSTAIITSAFSDITPQALIILGGMVTLSIVVFLVGWGIRRVFRALKH